MAILRRFLKSAPWISPAWRECYFRVRSLSPFLTSFVSSLLIKRKIERVAKGSSPVIVGPWLSEVGFEVLYWIPFLNWVTSQFSLSKNRVIVISRGGVASWYNDIGTNYVDVFDYLTPEEFKAQNAQRIAQTGAQKQLILSDFDKDILQLVKQTLDIGDAALLHPSLMYRLFMFFWQGQCSVDFLEKHIRFTSLVPLKPNDPLKGLPNNYIAVKFYTSSSFPNTQDNRFFVSSLLQRLASQMDVVMLNTNLKVDDHYDFALDASARLFSIEDLITPQNNLGIQTRVICRAKAFIGTCGGLAWLAPMLGVNTIPIFSNDSRLQRHLDVAHRAFASIQCGSFVPLHVHDLDCLLGALQTRV